MKQESRGNNEPQYIPEDDAQESAAGTVKKLKKQLKAAKEEKQEYLDGWQRERADFANYKREMEKYLESAREAAREDIILQLLSVFDNMELMVKHVPEDIEGTEWYKGVKHVYTQFQQTLKAIGLEEIECEGKEFDPTMHEAIEGPSSAEGREGTEVVREVVQKGYKMGGKVLRVAKVKVG